MARKIRQTQEEDIVNLLKKEGFIELPEKQIKEEPYKSIYTLPDCLRESEFVDFDQNSSVSSD